MSEKNEIKSRRYWRPNVHSKRLWSESLGHFIRTRITTRVLRTLDKVGGLDEYLLGGKAARIKELGMGGWKLRWRIMQTDAVKERFRVERVKFGLVPVGTDFVSSTGELVTQAQVEEEVRAFDEEIQKGLEVDVGEDEKVEMGFMQEKSADGRQALL